MIKKELRSCRKILTRDSAQRLHISRYENYGNDYCENGICNNDINIKNNLSGFNNLTNNMIFKLMINAIRVKIKIVNFTTFSFLFRDIFAKTDFFARDRDYLRYICNGVIIIDKLIDVRNNNRDNNA